MEKDINMIDISQLEECRMYEQEYPKTKDLVMCKITENLDEGSNVELLEYNCINGMILKSEISRKRIKNLAQLMKEGKEEVLEVVRVDTSQGYIDLSKKDLKEDEIKNFQDKYAKSKLFHNIMKSVCLKIGEPNLKKLYLAFGWKMYKDFDHAYNAIEKISKSREEADKILSNYEIDNATKKALIDIIALKMTAPSVKLNADFILKCITERGVEDLKACLRIGESVSTNEIKLTIKTKTSPLYEISTETVKKNEAIALMREALDKIRLKAEDLRCEYLLHKAVRVFLII